MSDISKSLKEIFDERISSPFYGSLIVSWLLWNWKIPYITFFVDGDILKEISKVNKIDYVLDNCINIWHLVIFPLLSTAIILLVVPYITNGAYLITLKFDQWRIKKKNEIEGRRLLTIEESARMHLEHQNLRLEFSEILNEKNSEIEYLKKDKDQQANNFNEMIRNQTRIITDKDKEINDLSKKFDNTRDLLGLYKGQIKKYLTVRENKINGSLQEKNDLHNFLNSPLSQTYDEFVKFVVSDQSKYPVMPNELPIDYLDLGFVSNQNGTFHLTEKGIMYYNEVILLKEYLANSDKIKNDVNYLNDSDSVRNFINRGLS